MEFNTDEIIWHKCDFADCTYSTKRKSYLNKHMMYKHNIGVKWKYCNFPECTFKAKETSKLNRHIIITHKTDEIIWKSCV